MTLTIPRKPKNVWQGHKPAQSQKNKIKAIAAAQKRKEAGK
jgi:hypothetical protein